MNIIYKNIKLRLVEEDSKNDAEFILSLRNNPELNKYISSTDNNINTQIDWIKKYKIREKNKLEYYFIIESISGEKYGTVRLYDFIINKNNNIIINESFCWGSWIIKLSRPSGTVMTSIILSMSFGFYDLNFKQARIDVRKNNYKAINIYKYINAKIIPELEDQDNYYFEYTLEDFENFKNKYI